MIGLHRKNYQSSFNGKGSPFLNLDNVKIAIDNSKNKDGLEYGRTRITVSTVGVGIKKDDIDAIEWAKS